MTQYMITASNASFCPQLFLFKLDHPIVILQASPDELKYDINNNNRGNNRGWYPGMYEEAIAKGTLKTEFIDYSAPSLPSDEDLGFDPEIADHSILDFLDELFLRHVAKHREGSVIVSDRMSVLGRAEKLDIPFLNSDQFLKLHLKHPKHQEMDDKFRAFKRYRYFSELFRFVSLMVLVIAGVAAYNFKQLIPYLQSIGLLPLFAIMIFMFAVFLYWLRCKDPLIYGTTEVVAGITGIVIFVQQYQKLDIAATLQVLGSIYVIVRGMDNIDRGVTNTPLEEPWQKIFSKGRSLKPVR